MDEQLRDIKQKLAEISLELEAQEAWGTHCRLGLQIGRIERLLQEPALLSDLDGTLASLGLE